MRIYLDNCCYNRPYDSQETFKISMETRAKLHIQDEIKQGEYELVSSYMLEYENSQNPDSMKRISIKKYLDEYSSYIVPVARKEKLQPKINELMENNLSYKDATHLAAAIFAKCEYLLTTDIKFQRRYKGEEIKILNPLEFANLEEE